MNGTPKSTFTDIELLIDSFRGEEIKSYLLGKEFYFPPRIETTLMINAISHKNYLFTVFA